CATVSTMPSWSRSSRGPPRSSRSAWKAARSGASATSAGRAIWQLAWATRTTTKASSRRSNRAPTIRRPWCASTSRGLWRARERKRPRNEADAARRTRHRSDRRLRALRRGSSAALADELIHRHDRQHHRQHEHKNDAAHDHDKDRLHERGERGEPAFDIRVLFAGGALQHRRELSALLAVGDQVHEERRKHALTRQGARERDAL